ncbi:YeeE/YedE thiosulfate transporter family protein [Dyella sp. RRB7]|uniref:YeeE/YedE family protein n=1 Tax=Dyella sp. RRB7 TaxID=2919502 RepID=UPI001FAA1ABC|nr:YeeE/YedE thiosulfate transporter family protein [Dyella sp. RRB7]
MSSFTPVSALLGGLLIGGGASLLLLSLGRMAGISGIVGALPFSRRIELAWRALFLLGLVAGAALLYRFGGPFGVQAPVSRAHFPAWLLIVAGLLVGYGTAMSHGCTSGHGVCGLARRSPRSLVATLVFLLTGMFTASVLRHWLGG